jgi:acyl-CoA reductase-like NAD-dependent aldehyde dehydrogenase
MRVAHEEIFGPVLCLVHAKDLDEAIEIINSSDYGNAASIFTTSGGAARQFKYAVQPSMLGINIGFAAPMAFFPFGGCKESFFGATKAHGTDAVDFYTDKKIIIALVLIAQPAGTIWLWQNLQLSFVRARYVTSAFVLTIQKTSWTAAEG